MLGARGGIYVLKSVASRYLEIAFGSAIANLSTDQIKNTPFPLPPMAQQERIVAKVDELLEMCDELEKRLREREDVSSKLAAGVVQWIGKSESSVPVAS